MSKYDLSTQYEVIKTEMGYIRDDMLRLSKSIDSLRNDMKVGYVSHPVLELLKRDLDAQDKRIEDLESDRKKIAMAIIMTIIVTLLGTIFDITP